METFDIDNPQWSAVANYIQAVTTAPTNKMYNKIQNLRQAANADHTAMQRLFMLFGWSQWNLGIENVKMRDIRDASKEEAITL